MNMTSGEGSEEAKPKAMLSLFDQIKMKRAGKPAAGSSEGVSGASAGAGAEDTPRPPAVSFLDAIKNRRIE
jgi:hypothetical protein